MLYRFLKILEHGFTNPWRDLDIILRRDWDMVLPILKNTGI